MIIIPALSVQQVVTDRFNEISCLPVNSVKKILRRPASQTPSINFGNIEGKIYFYASYINRIYHSCDDCHFLFPLPDPVETYGHINSKSLVFVHGEDIKHFGDLFLNGDMEGIHRIMQILQQRELLEVIEMDAEIYLVNHNPASIENIRAVPRGLSVSDYHPVEDLRTLRASDNSFRHVSLEEGRMSVRKPLKVFKAEEITNDLFMSDFDVLEILKHLSPQAPFFSTSKA